VDPTAQGCHLRHPRDDHEGDPGGRRRPRRRRGVALDRGGLARVGRAPRRLGRHRARRDRVPRGSAGSASDAIRYSEAEVPAVELLVWAAGAPVVGAAVGDPPVSSAMRMARMAAQADTLRSLRAGAVHQLRPGVGRRWITGIICPRPDSCGLTGSGRRSDVLVEPKHQAMLRSLSRRSVHWPRIRSVLRVAAQQGGGLGRDPAGRAAQPLQPDPAHGRGQLRRQLEQRVDGRVGEPQVAGFPPDPAAARGRGGLRRGAAQRAAAVVAGPAAAGWPAPGRSRRRARRRRWPDRF